MGDFGLADWVGPAISAVGSLGGGILAGAGQTKDGWSKTAFNEQALGSMLWTPYLNRANIQSTYQNLMEVAKQYKLHPLAVLGNPPSQASLPSGYAGGSSLGSDYGIGESLRSMGQDITRAMSARQTPEERAATRFNLEILEQKSYQSQLDTQIKQQELEQAKGQPTLPLQVTDLGEVKDQTIGNPAVVAKPAQVIPIDKQGNQMGIAAALKWYRKGNKVFLGKTEDFSEATEEDFFGNLQYFGMRGIDYLKGVGGEFPSYPPMKNNPGMMWKFKPWGHYWEEEPIKTYRSLKKATRRPGRAVRNPPRRKTKKMFYAPTFE